MVVHHVVSATKRKCCGRASVHSDACVGGPRCSYGCTHLAFCYKKTKISALICLLTTASRPHCRARIATTCSIVALSTVPERRVRLPPSPPRSPSAARLSFYITPARLLLSLSGDSSCQERRPVGLPPSLSTALGSLPPSAMASNNTDKIRQGCLR
jgi:hypothetical protein